jgi:hypothetical protein
MKITMIGMVVALLVAASPALRAEVRDGHIDRMLRRQQQLIRRGINANQFTPREAVRLQRELTRINRQEERAESDGRLTPIERRHLRGELRRERRNIFRAAHN